MMVLILSIVAFKAVALLVLGWWLFRDGGAFDRLDTR